MHNDIDPMLSDMVEPIPVVPQETEWVRLDEPLFDEFGASSDTITLEKRDSQGRRWLRLEGRWSPPGM